MTGYLTGQIKNIVEVLTVVVIDHIEFVNNIQSTIQMTEFME